MYCITGMSHTKKSMFSKDKLQNNDTARPSIKWNPAAEQKCQPLAFGCWKMQVLQYEPCVTIKTPETKDMWTGMSWSDAQRWHTPSPHSSFPATWSNGVTYSSVSAQQRQTRSPVHQGAPRSSDAVWIWREACRLLCVVMEPGWLPVGWQRVYFLHDWALFQPCRERDHSDWFFSSAIKRCDYAQHPIFNQS